MKRTSLFFEAPYKISMLDEVLDAVAPSKCCVRTVLSGISAGTELLVYRGQWPQHMSVDETITALAGDFSYPLKYGYAAVGVVTEVGTDVSPDLIGTRVFSFNPHESHFVADVSDLMIIPDSVSTEDAIFLPNMETALGLIMDGNPIIGETVVVFGLGVVGLLTTSLLGKFPLQAVISIDPYAMRRDKSIVVGATCSLDPSDPETTSRLHKLLATQEPWGGADLVYEVSGNPAALDQAISICGFASRIIVGSWYGAKNANLSLGDKFHRSRIRIISSQVSRLDPSLTGRWDKTRRINLAWQCLERLKPSGFITHKIPFSRATDAYQLLDQTPDQLIQVVFEYEENA